MFEYVAKMLMGIFVAVVGVFIFWACFHPLPGIPTPLEAGAWIGHDAGTGMVAVFAIVVFVLGIWMMVDFYRCHRRQGR
ncbi:MAG: hypothetical protein BWY43_00003 [candidate division WS2 bacterium ADurb.Bin280]|uniref:Uncharacterized protein n=1 Tax=candidate division WS2 bacterium ADurb.Bin280 TaxID=1852829 RepID=A0A1V5SHK6_9BACT|nr:MAG: hypothetical protein BWY43_00003 [candidate division WS2 bacterium ADurb.Bin280]